MPTATKPQPRGPRFIAVDRFHGGRIIAQGSTAKAVLRKAERTGKPFTMAFVPQPGRKHIF